MGLTRFILFVVALALLAGCTISRAIVDIKPPHQPPLQQLDQNLAYTDPDEGRPDYIIKP